MSVVSETMRAAVIARAEQRCEYCHLPMRGQVATFVNYWPHWACSAK